MELLNSTIEFISENYQWLFSGLGIVVAGAIFGRRSFSTNKVSQNNINAGGDVVGRDKK
ncbi:MAG: hypothetical protein K6L60_12830 [Oceanobacter sp.]